MTAGSRVKQGWGVESAFLPSRVLSAESPHRSGLTYTIAVQLIPTPMIFEGIVGIASSCSVRRYGKIRNNRQKWIFEVQIIKE